MGTVSRHKIAKKRKNLPIVSFLRGSCHNANIKNKTCGKERKKEKKTTAGLLLSRFLLIILEKRVKQTISKICFRREYLLD